MSEEFCLSEKRKVWVPSDNYAYLPEDVKEFIRRLKEDLKKVWCSGFISLSEECFYREWDKAIKKRAGKELVWALLRDWWRLKLIKMIYGR